MYHITVDSSLLMYRVPGHAAYPIDGMLRPRLVVWWASMGEAFCEELFYEFLFPLPPKVECSSGMARGEKRRPTLV